MSSSSSSTPHSSDTESIVSGGDVSTVVENSRLKGEQIKYHVQELLKLIPENEQVKPAYLRKHTLRGDVKKEGSIQYMKSKDINRKYDIKSYQGNTSVSLSSNRDVCLYDCVYIDLKENKNRLYPEKLEAKEVTKKELLKHVEQGTVPDDWLTAPLRVIDEEKTKKMREKDSEEQRKRLFSQIQDDSENIHKSNKYIRVMTAARLVIGGGICVVMFIYFNSSNISRNNDIGNSTSIIRSLSAYEINGTSTRLRGFIKKYDNIESNMSYELCCCMLMLLMLFIYVIYHRIIEKETAIKDHPETGKAIEFTEVREGKKDYKSDNTTNTLRRRNRNQGKFDIGLDAKNINFLQESMNEAFKTNKSLKKLNLRNNNITDVQSIGDALKTNESLEKLYLGNNKQSIGDALKTNNTLKTLSLHNHNITDVQSIGEGLKTNNTLEILWLNNNNITDVQSIGEALKRNNTLKKLYLYHNNITDVQSIGEGLKINNSLTRLSLRSNNITDVQSIGEGLKSNKTLMTLYLDNNNITDVQSIGEGLKTNNTLEELRLDTNNITDDSGMQSIIDGLKTNNTLNTLYLSNNQLSDNMKSQLRAIKQYKRDGSNGYQQVKGMEIFTG